MELFIFSKKVLRRAGTLANHKISNSSRSHLQTNHSSTKGHPNDADKTQKFFIRYLGNYIYKE